MDDKVKYFHELSDEEYEILMDNKEKITWEECAKKYPAPSWCGHGSGAVCGIMGCWSLMGSRVIEQVKQRIRKIEDCEGCDLVVNE